MIKLRLDKQHRKIEMGNSESTATSLGKHSTAREVVDKLGGKGSLAGKIAVVTGTNSGIGTETVKQLAYAGAQVIASARNVDQGVAALKAAEVIMDHVTVEELNLEDLESIKAFSDKVKKLSRVDFLVFNAGIMALPTLERTKYGWERQLGTNHHGHFYLLTLVLDKIKAQKFPSRIIAVSSMAHRRGEVNLKDLHFTTKDDRPYEAWSAYGQSKAANILMIRELADRCGSGHITCLSLHPGVIMTNLTRHMGYPSWMLAILGPFFMDKTIEQGASTTLAACLDPKFTESSGSYLSHCQVEETNEHCKDVTKELRVGLWKATEDDIKAALAAAKK